jgi:hypothetical protein
MRQTHLYKFDSFGMKLDNLQNEETFTILTIL